MALWLFCICHQQDLSWSYSLSLCSLLMWTQSCRMMICVCKSFNLICSKNILVSHCSQLLGWYCASAFAPLDSQLVSISYSALLSFIGGSLCNVNDEKTFLNAVKYIFFPVLLWQLLAYFWRHWSLGCLMRIHSLKEHHNSFLLFPSELFYRCSFVVYWNMRNIYLQVTTYSRFTLLHFKQTHQNFVFFTFVPAWE